MELSKKEFEELRRTIRECEMAHGSTIVTWKGKRMCVSDAFAIFRDATVKEPQTEEEIDEYLQSGGEIHFHLIKDCGGLKKGKTFDCFGGLVSVARLKDCTHINFWDKSLFKPVFK